MPAACTDKQLGYLEFLRKQLGMSPKDVSVVTNQVVGRELDGSLMSMTQSEASRVIDCLKVTVKLKGGKIAGLGWRTDVCTQGQLEYIERLRLKRKFSRLHVSAYLQVSDLNQITKEQASGVIEWLKR